MIAQVLVLFALIAVTVGHENELTSAVYTVIFPSKIRPNIPFHVSVSAHNLQSPLELNVDIEGPADDGQYHNLGKHITLVTDETQTLNFQIGEWSSGNYSLIVVGAGDINFQNSSILTYEQKSFSVFIQTDKAIYNPGQLVQFRVLVVTPYLQPSVTGDIKIFITDANRNRIKQWDNVFTTRGIASAELLLSDQPVLGDWAINVDILGQSYKKSFTVAQYVLPHFEVELVLPPYVTYSKPDCVATVTAKYTYGKAVKGHVKMIVEQSFKTGYVSNEPSITEAEIDGSINMPLNIVRDLGLQDTNSTLNIDVIVEVEEYLTKRKYNISSILHIYNMDIKVDLVKSTDYFKPGLKYTALLKLSYQDGTPVVGTDGETFTLKYYYSNENWNTLQVPVPHNGLLNVDFYPPDYPNVTCLGMIVEFHNFEHRLDNVKRAWSASNNFIQILLNSVNPTVGQEVEFEINATEYLTNLVYKVLGRGDIILAKTLKVPNVKTFKLTFPVTHKMAPKVRIIVFYVRPENNEIVADALNFEVTGLFKTSVNIHTIENAMPGDLVNVTVATTPNALVGLLGIDQGVILLKSGNDITESDVLMEIETYDTKKRMNYNNYDRKKRSMSFLESTTAYDVFDDSGVIILTNGHTYKPISNHGTTKRVKNIPKVQYRKYFELEDDVDDVDWISHRSGGSVSNVRNHFPETWIWDLSPAGNDGMLTLGFKVPDTMTSWVISAFAMDQVNGLGIAPVNAKVTVFESFFVTLNLPYSVVRSESFYLEVILFNYDKEPVKADVSLENPIGAFEFTMAGNDSTHSQDKKTKFIEVPAEDGASVLFLITPRKLGYINLKVTATAFNAWDSVEKKLLVKPEGVPKFFNEALLLNLKDADSEPIETVVEIDVPTEAVPGSIAVTLTAIGDLLGPTVHNLDKLLRIPQGCGEQNMLNFVPNIVITKYLKHVNRLTTPIENNARKLMESGYQRELTYCRSDGSFSSFGNSDKNGSTWLTAFVVRSFHQAKELMDIDEDVMNTALEWLAKQQKADGSFGEPGEVHHKAMQGRPGSKNTLTAYVLLAFLETKAQNTFGPEMEKAFKYLQEELSVSRDPYFISIAAYAFNLADHDEKDNAMQKLLSFSRRGVDTLYWHKPTRYYLPQSRDVEMTAYALLTYCVRGDVAGALPILRWLISQQNEFGGYSSTQDTVIGIQALGSLGMKLSSTSISISIMYSTNDIIKSLTINSGNAMILQKVDLPSDTNSVKLKAEGFGVGIVQVTWSYNIESVDKLPAFFLNPVLGEATTNDYLDLNICTKFHDDVASNMAVMEVGLPTGFQADLETLPSINPLQKIKRVETQDGDTSVVFYFDRIDSEKTCVHVPAYRNFKVANQKPVPVHVYDYYDLSKNAIAFYEPRIAGICNICEDQECECACNNNNFTYCVNSGAVQYHTLFVTFVSLFSVYYARKANKLY